jgi:hypothetical protein
MANQVHLHSLLEDGLKPQIIATFLRGLWITNRIVIIHCQAVHIQLRCQLMGVIVVIHLRKKL